MLSLRERSLKELQEIRSELLVTAERISPQEFDWLPRPGMKSAKSLLKEIGTMEQMHVLFLSHGEVSDWDNAVNWSGEDLGSILEDLKSIRDITQEFLQRCTERRFETLRPVPGVWQQWWGKEASPEAMISWVMRHEYYHLGQLIYNRWLLGYNPYES